MSTGKLVREFRRKAKSLGYRIEAITATSGSGHLRVVVMHSSAQQRLALPSSPASIEHSIKHALDEMRRFKEKHATHSPP